MHPRATLLLLSLLLSACAGKQQKPDPNLIWSEQGSPYAFHRSVVYTLLASGEITQALPHVKRMLLVQPGSVEAHYLLARCYLELKLYQETRAEVEQAIALDRGYAAAHSLKGVLLDRLGEHEKAEAAHRQALVLSPQAAQYHNNLAFGLYLQGRYEAAISSFRTAIALDPQLKRIHNNIGFAFARMQRFDDALRHFRIGGSEAEAHNNLGFAYEQESKTPEAILQYKSALQKDSELLPAQENLNRLVGATSQTNPAAKPLSFTATVVEENLP